MATVDARDYSLSRATVLTEGYKGLLAVNGASVAAMLAFIAQIASKSAALTSAAFVAIAIFTVGLAFAMLVPYFRYHHSVAVEKAERERLPHVREGWATRLELTDVLDSKRVTPTERLTWWLYTAAQYLSVAAFLAGFCYLATVGYYEVPKLSRSAQLDCAL
jgi:ABC-type multidrug transport system permease subunit